MRPGQQNKRGRGRGNNNNNGGGGSSGGGGGNNFNRKGSNPLTRSYDSSGPDIKVRGTAQHIAEKYATLARDAQSSGDRVMAENYLQHAEHYNRIIASAQAQMQERFQRDDRQDYNERDQDDSDGADMDDNNYVGQQMNTPQHQPHHQPQAQPQPQPQAQPQHQPQAQPAAPQPRRAPAQNRAPAPVRAPAPELVPAPVAVVAPPVENISAVDGSGPQPVIEGVPAEVALEAEGATAQPRERQPRRRAASNRPRRPRRPAEGEEGAEPNDSDAPTLADVSSE